MSGWTNRKMENKYGLLIVFVLMMKSPTPTTSSTLTFTHLSMTKEATSSSITTSMTNEATSTANTTSTTKEATSTSITTSTTTEETSDSITTSTTTEATSNSNITSMTTEETSSSITPLTTTEAESSSITPSTARKSTHSTTLKSDANYIVNTSTLPLALNLNIFINKEFPTTPNEIQNLEQQFNNTLYKAFWNVTKFKEIEIIKIRRGSVICDFKIVYKSGTKLNEIETDFNTHVTALENETIGGVKVNVSNLKEAFQSYVRMYKSGSDACQLYDDLIYCDFGYVCNVTNGVTKCVSKCKTYDCGDGQCFFNRNRNTPVCRCPENDEHIYTGDKCETKIEKLSLSKDYIIAISAGCGGLIIIVLSIIVIVLCVKRMKSTQSSSKDSSINDVVRDNDTRHKQHNSGIDNTTFEMENRNSRYDEQEARGMSLHFNGRQHNVYTDYDQSKAYMYSPSNQPERSNYGNYYETIGSSLLDIPPAKVDIPRVRINRH